MELIPGNGLGQTAVGATLKDTIAIAPPLFRSDYCGTNSISEAVSLWPITLD